MVTRKMRAKVSRSVLVILVVFVSTCILAEKCFASRPPQTLPPHAVLTVVPEYTLVVKENITLDGRESHDEDTKGKDPEITLFQWDVDYDGGEPDWLQETTSVITHSYDSPGEYRVLLRVTDNDRSPETNDVECTVSVEEPSPPVAVLTVDPEYALVDENITLDGTGSHDGDSAGEGSEITLFQWDVDYDGGDPDWDYQEATGVITYSYDSPGIYTVLLRVTDNENPADTDDVECTVYVRPSGIIYVPGDVPTIQEAIDIAVDGYTIEVAEGPYYENINFKGKAITLTSSDPCDWNVVAATIIDASGLGDAVTFDSGSDPCSVITGFTITTGSYYGILCDVASPTISKCIITGNYNGIYTLGGSSVVVDACKIHNNTSRGILFSGGSPTVKNCLIYENTYGIGMGGGSCPIITNNTVVDNTDAGIRKARLSIVYPTITNCIVWNGYYSVGYAMTTTYSCIEGGHVGEGNISDNPLFVPDDQFYHLQSSSPCIDAGDNDAVDWDYDIDGENRVMELTVDMGADEYKWPERVYNVTKVFWYSHIQRAIDESDNGNVIQVTGGTYYENIDFKGKDITVESHPANTTMPIIDGDLNGSVVTFAGNEGTSLPCKLTGFKITNGWVGEPTENLLAHWKFDEIGGTTADDSAGSNDGTLIGDPVWTSTEGKIDGALIFDGEDDCVVVPDTASLSNMANITISTWINPDTIDPCEHGYRIISKWDPTDKEFIIKHSQTALGGSGELLVGFYTEYKATTTFDLPVGSWTHLCVVWDGTEYVKVYKNGVLNETVELDDIPDPCDSAAPTVIGKHGSTETEYFDGFIDDVRIYDRALGDVEIKQLHDWDTKAGGGGILGNGTSADISNCVIEGNTADYGGGIYGVKGDIENTIFRDNFAGGNAAGLAGGAIYNENDCNPDIINCTFTTNSAGTPSGDDSYGGAIANYNSNPNIIGCTFTENFVEAAAALTCIGGAICNYNSSPIIDKCVFVENRAGPFVNAEGSGGAIGNYNENCNDTYEETPIITNCTFSWNYAICENGRGGAIYNKCCNTKITNCVFADNVADAEGGALYTVGSDYYTPSPTITNCTFKGNISTTTVYLGGAIYSSSSYPVFINCIIWNDFDPKASGSITGPAGFKNCNIEGCGGSGDDWFRAPEDDFGGNIDTNPNYANPVDPAGPDGIFGTIDDGLIPGFGVDCIDAGDDANVPTEITTDITGRVRITDGDHDGAADVDMGAYEVPRVYFVKGSVSGGLDNGTSWEDAYDDLQDALDAASSGDEIWVAEGTYYPPTTAGYIMKAGVDLYGGFDGTEGTGLAGPAGLPRGFVRRNVETHETILSGDIEPTNCYYVVTGSDDAILDGFTITGASSYGIYCNATSPMISRCVITGNDNGIWTSGSLLIDACKIHNNSSLGIACNIESPTVKNSLIYENLGGIACGDGSSPIFTNITVVDNTSAGILRAPGGATPTITNCIVWGNAFNLPEDFTATHSCIQGWSSGGTGNISTNPNFVNAANNNYHLSLKTSTSAQSPCINAASPTYSAGKRDLDGNMRIVDYRPDMGAYESPKVWFVDNSATGDDDGTCWTHAFVELQDALDVCQERAGHEIWVAAGTYKPSLETDPADSRTKTFQLLDGVSIYGGFEGGEKQRSERDWETNLTTLSGDIGTTGDPNDNCYHVVTGSGVGLKTQLDGFTVTDGDANSITDNDHKSGGGMYNYLVGPTVYNCKFEGNFAQGYFLDLTHSLKAGGGAVYNEASKPAFVQCEFNVNSSVIGGGAMFNTRSVAYLSGCKFDKNSATGEDCFGGAIINLRSPIIISNCTFTDNRAGDEDSDYPGVGGVMYTSTACPIITNCIFTDNSAVDGPGVMKNVYSGSRIFNCTFSNNFSIDRISGVSPGVMSNFNGDWLYNNIEVNSPLIVNSLFVGNTGAGTYGAGAIHNTVCNPTLINCTFTENSSNSGAIKHTNSTPVMTNCIFWGNTTDDPEVNYDVYISDDCYAVFNNCCYGVIKDYSSPFSTVYTVYTGYSFQLDPCFVDDSDPDGDDDIFGTADDGLSLQSDSPCIGRGDNSAVSDIPIDLAGQPRIQGDPLFVDIGAYESTYDFDPPEGPDTVDITVAVDYHYDCKTHVPPHQLIVNATSSYGPYVTLTLEGLDAAYSVIWKYGAMTWISDNEYNHTYDHSCDVEDPTSVKVSSSKGGSAIETVTVIE